MTAIRAISPQALKHRLAQVRPGAAPELASAPELALLDVAEEGEYGLGHLLWAASTPYSRLELLVPPLVPRLGCPLVLVDHGDGIAAVAARRLATLGYRELAVLEGGTPAWAAAGGELFHGVYVPGKAFGEWLEHSHATPAISADELLRLRAAGVALQVLDPRTPAEHALRHVPGALSCPGGELLHRFRDLVPQADTLVVLACGGRTRGIVGAQTLISAGVPNRVVALADGCHGWQLAGHALESGDVVPAVPPSATAAAFGREHAQRLAQQSGTPEITAAVLAAWREAGDRTTYVFDVRSAEEYAAGHLAGARWAAGGQLLQASDRWMATLGARVVLVDDDGVRAHQIAHWLRALGWPAAVLAGGLAAAREAGLPCVSGPAAAAENGARDADSAARVQLELAAGRRSGLPELSPAQAATRLQAGARAWCLDGSADFLRAHPPGARWANRARLQAVVAEARAGTELLLFSADAAAAHLAGLDLAEQAPAGRIAVVAGGLRAWERAGLPLHRPDAAEAERLLPQAQRVDVLYWAHDRRRGNHQAMRAYLDWERQLLAQLARDGERFFLAGGAGSADAAATAGCSPAAAAGSTAPSTGLSPFTSPQARRPRT